MDSAHYVYAIVRRDAPLPTAGIGIAGVELQTASWRDLAAVTARVPAGEPAVTASAVLHHETVVEAVRQWTPALPVRFGTVFHDTRSITLALAERYDALAADLERLGDKVELSLTALWASPPDDEVGMDARDEGAAGVELSAGAQYLHARAAAFRRADAMEERSRVVARQLDEMLAGLALEQRSTLRPTPRVAVRTAYLLDAAGVSAFRTAVDALRTDSACRLLLTGPWPPYSFVGRGAGASATAPATHVTALARQLTNAMQGRHG